MRCAQQLLELVRVEAEATLLPERQRHGGGAREPDSGLVDREAGIRVDDLVTGPAGREHGEEEERLGAVRDEHVPGVDGDAARGGQRHRGGLAQGGQPCRLAVVGLAGPDRGDPRLGHVRRRLEVRLADLEVDHVAARRLERASTGEHRERALGAEASHRLGDARSHRSHPIAATLHRA